MISFFKQLMHCDSLNTLTADTNQNLLTIYEFANSGYELRLV